MKKQEGKCPINLDNLTIEEITDYHEMCDFETILSRCHPLGYRKAQGARICYAVSHKGEWVAVAMFDQAVYRNHMRERRIGWNEEQLIKRRKHIANNSRFLVMEREGGDQNNLASKVLSMITEQISKDWFRKYGVPLLAVETYVDPDHNNNQRTCYKAAGWENLGLSTGFQEAGQERTHGKWYFLKELHHNSYKALSSELTHPLLTGIKPVSGKSNNNYVLDTTKFRLKDLQKELAKIPDPRKRHGTIYPFVPFLSLCIVAVISGYTQYRQIADWIRGLSGKERVRFGMPADLSPHETTVAYLISRIDPTILHDILSKWLMEVYGKNINFKDVLIDGKALRATSGDTEHQVGFLNVFTNELGIVIEQLPTKKGGAEKNAAKQFLDSDIDLSNKVIMADAIHTDQKFVEKIIKKKPRIYSLLKATK